MAEDGETREFSVGPNTQPWWKFKLAGVAWKLTRGNPIPYVGYVPGAERRAMWSLRVRVLSRDFEEVED